MSKKVTAVLGAVALGVVIVVRFYKRWKQQ